MPWRQKADGNCSDSGLSVRELWTWPGFDRYGRVEMGVKCFSLAESRFLKDWGDEVREGVVREKEGTFCGERI